MRVIIPQSEDSYAVIPVNTVSELVLANTVYKINAIDAKERMKQILSVCFCGIDTFNREELYDGESCNRHIDYLSGYLKYHDQASGFDVKTIVIESKYVSLSFLKDFANYYSLGYNNISRYCKRVHFFEDEFNLQEFEVFIIQPNKGIQPPNLLNSYYGHVVIKPLPNSLIGASLIRCYKEYFQSKALTSSTIAYNNKNREFKTLRDYDINLFGKPYSIKTLVFQEQDRAISACATVALWMSFHKLSALFRTRLPVPSEITKSAGLQDSKGRSFPSSGLQTDQIIRAIDLLDSNTVSEVFTGTYTQRIAIQRQIVQKKIIQPWKIKRYVYAYLHLEIPALLGYNVLTRDGNHLVTITGYRQEKEEEAGTISNSFPSLNDSSIITEADRIQRLYCHDDQLGPFSKIGFNTNGFENYINVNWRDEKKYNLAAPILFIVPIIDFIKIDYNVIEIFAESFNQFFKQISLKYTQNLIWDIYIIKSNEYKSQFTNFEMSKDIKLDFLKRSFPQYIWVANLSLLTDPRTYNKKIKLLDFIFDATDTPKSMNLFELYFHNKLFKEKMTAIFAQEEDLLFKKYTKLFPRKIYLKRIAEKLKKSDNE